MVHLHSVLDERAGSFVSRYSRLLAMASLIGVVVFLTDESMGQATGGGSQSVVNNASAGAVASRAPGNLVSAAIAIHRARQDDNFAPNEITESGSVGSGDSNPIADQLKLDLLTQIINDITLAIVAINNLFRTGIGLPPDIPGLP